MLKTKILYFIMLRLMDLEEILWNAAELVIKPVVLLRRKAALAISKTAGFKPRGTEPAIKQ